MSAMICASHGCKVHYLGADLPPEEIGRYAREAGVAIVAISVVLLDGLAVLPAQLAALRAELGPDVPVWVGGQGALGLDEAALPAHCQVIADRGELERRLDVLSR
jgi:methylmalonyl-CoA mutase cobalamin-binding subunit